MLTDKAKQKIAANGINGLNIVKFALGDDEINYSETSSEILATRINEPNPNSNVALKFHLVTREVGVIDTVPIITTGADEYKILYNSKVTIRPEIANLSASKYTTTYNFSFDDVVGISISVDGSALTTSTSASRAVKSFNGNEIIITNTGVRVGKTINMVIKDNLSGATKTVVLDISVKA
jgi:hypothetical protein